MSTLQPPREGYIAYVWDSQAVAGVFGEHAYSLRSILWKARKLVGPQGYSRRVVVVGAEEGRLFEAIRDLDGAVIEHFVLQPGRRPRLSPLAAR